MPARAARPDRCLPRSFARFGRLPEGEVAGAVFFVFVHIDAGAVLHAREIFLGKLAVAGKFRDAEVVGAVFGAVGESLFLQLGDELRHFRDVIGGAHQNRLLDVERRRVFEKRFLIFCGVLLDAHAVAGGVADDLVVHVGDVHDVAKLGIRSGAGSVAECPRRQRCGSCRCGRSRRPWARRRTCGLRCPASGWNSSTLPESVL